MRTSWIVVATAALGLLVGSFALAAPKGKSDRDTSRKAPPVRKRAPVKKEKVEIITCPDRVPVKHDIQAPAGFRKTSSIRDYSLRVCRSNGTFVSRATKTVDCYYCDQRQTNKLKLTKRWPDGLTCKDQPRSASFRCTGR